MMAQDGGHDGSSALLCSRSEEQWLQPDAREAHATDPAGRAARQRHMAALTDDGVAGPPAVSTTSAWLRSAGGGRATTFASRAADSAPLFAKPECRAASTDGTKMTQMPAAPTCQSCSTAAAENEHVEGASPPRRAREPRRSATPPLHQQPELPE